MGILEDNSVRGMVFICRPSFPLAVCFTAKYVLSGLVVEVRILITAVFHYVIVGHRKVLLLIPNTLNELAAPLARGAAEPDTSPVEVDGIGVQPTLEWPATETFSSSGDASNNIRVTMLVNPRERLCH
jgi:hypothetical protein